MGKFIEDSISEIRKKFYAVKSANDKAQADYKKELELSRSGDRLPPPPVPDAVVIKLETASGSVEPRRLMILEVHDDYIVARGRKSPEPELFAFAHITNWKFVQYDPTQFSKG